MQKQKFLVHRDIAWSSVEYQDLFPENELILSHRELKYLGRKDMFSFAHIYSDSIMFFIMWFMWVLYLQ